MLERPVPKTELFIKSWGPNSDLKIIAGSADAESWLKQEAPLFGDLSQLEPDSLYYWLSVYEIYDFEEVVAYLKSYNDSQEEEVSK